FGSVPCAGVKRSTDAGPARGHRVGAGNRSPAVKEWSIVERERGVLAATQRRRTDVGGLAAKLIVLAYLIILYFPIYWMVTMAFKRRVDITILPPKFTFKPVLSNFEWLFVHQN